MHLVSELLLEGAVVAAFLVQVARIARRPVVWRLLREHRAAAAAAALLALPAVALAVVAASTSAPLRRAGAGVLAAGLALAAWRARPGYGVRAGLAPGSLGLGASLDAIDQRDFYLRQAARHGPVFKSSQFGRPVLCVVGLDRGRELILRQGRHLEGATLPYTRLIPKGALRYMRAEDHRQVAGLFRAAIAGTDLAGAEVCARNAFRSELRRLADACAGQAVGVRVRDAIEPALFGGMARILLGLEPGRPEAEEIRAWMPSLDFARFGGRAWRRRIEAGLDAVTGILRRAAADASAPLVPPSALGRIGAAQPDALGDRTVAANLVLIFRMSNLDTAGLFEWIAKQLSDHPVWRERLRAQGRVAGPPPARSLDLGTRIVMETLRLERSEYLYRRAAETFEFGGYRVPKGWLIRVCIQESHRDPAVFADPTRFDPDRFAARAYGRDEYAPLGADTHGCMGTAIIHFLGRLFAEELALGFDWEVVDDGPLERGTRHWHHWRPSGRFRIALRPWAEPERSVAASAGAGGA